LKLQCPWARSRSRRSTEVELKTLTAHNPMTDIIHKSKIGLEILIPVAVVICGITTVMIINSIWPGLIICALITLFIASIYARTFYKITNNNRLLIKCGFIESFDININEIEWIKKTNELTNAPALSVDRLEIGYKGGRVLVSPQDKNKFVSDLKKINAKIWWTK
jgi:hypothetical protein